MATTVKELKATARPKSGKGAARAERRAGRVPGVIYGNNQPPVTISIADRELRQRILAGRFLTTMVRHRPRGQEAPRDSARLSPRSGASDFPIHVDFMRLGEGATIRISVPLHVVKAETSPGVKRGGTVNIVTHTRSSSNAASRTFRNTSRPMSAPSKLVNSLHLTDIKLPAGVKALTRADATLVTIVPPSGYAEEQKAAAALRLLVARLPACGLVLLRQLRRRALLLRLLGCQGTCRRRQEEVISQGWRAVPDRNYNCLAERGARRVMRLFVGLGNPGAKYAR